ncbi:PF20097 family protein [Vallitalea maricola]|uniref:PF20097 family protein n=1 Tax=Vallitalea maricola TaxID=3074433 RepID=UPI0033653175
MMRWKKGFYKACGLAWVKKQHKVSLLPKPGEVLLQNNAFKDVVISAWICKKCKKLFLIIRIKIYKRGR